MIHLKPWLPRILSLDFGFDHHSCVLWIATDGENYFIYRELVVNHLTGPELAALIAERTPTTNVVGAFDERKAIKVFYAGPDIFSAKTSDRTIAIEMDSYLAGCGFGFSGITRAAAAPGDRVLGWQFVYQLMKQGRLKVSPGCKEVRKAIPAAIRDYPLKGEDIKKVPTIGDDVLDSLRYGLYTSSLQPKIPLEVEALKRVTAPMDNLLARKIQFQDAAHDIRRRRQGISFGR